MKFYKSRILAVAACLVGAGAIAYAAVYGQNDSRVLMISRHITQTLEQNLYLVPEPVAVRITYQLQTVAQELDSALGHQPPNPPQPLPPPNPYPPQPLPPPAPNYGYYCSVACTTLDGKPDLQFTAGAAGSFQDQALQNARDSLKQRFNCNYGVTTIGCSQQTYGNSYSCVAACKTLSGAPDLQFAAAGTASNQTQAQELAHESVRSQYNCNYGIIDSECSNDNRPAYCIAACKTLSGTADPSFSKGATGSNTALAKINALKAVTSSYNCNYGVMIDHCDVQ